MHKKDVPKLKSSLSLKPEFRPINNMVLDIRMPIQSRSEMPTGSGMEVLAQVKEEEPPPVIIMLTNYPYPQYRRKCIEAGADYFFDKSTEFRKVAEVLETLAQREVAPQQ